MSLEAPPPLTLISRFQKQLAVFDVGVAKPRINQKLCADLVTLSKAGRTVLSKGTHSKTPAASNLDEWR